MNWRRGILLAGIHLAVAVPLIVMQEARVEAFLSELHQLPAKDAGEETAERAASLEEGQTVTFSPCGMWAEYSAPVEVVQGADMPAVGFSGWSEVCPSHLTLAGILHAGYPWRGLSSITAERKLCWGLGLLIAPQWFLVGAFPLIRPKRWWAEPGAFITVCAVIAFPFALIWPNDHVARLPALLAMLAWFWWFGLLVWKGGRFGWKHLRAG